MTVTTLRDVDATAIADTPIHYRPDIDGLRAIAVLAVVGFHAFPYWVRGGYIGVDVFFVISGFLISSVIFKSLDQGDFSFTDFYARRIRRIFPALIVVLLACQAFGWFSLLADEYRQLGEHIATGAAFLSNFELWKETGYFDNSSDLKPLLHLWSLGIEEQFYLVWPLTLVVFRWRRLSILALGLWITAISFAFSLYKIHTDPVQAFYSPVCRFWELTVGSVLSYVTWRGSPSKSKGRIGSSYDRTFLRGAGGPNVLSMLGTLLIGAGVLLLSKDTRFPGAWALLPTVGTLLIVSAGQRAWLNRALLSNRVIVAVGLISYPLYLWHWPLLSFIRIIYGGNPSPAIRIVAILVSLLLASLTYLLVERPIRFGKYKSIAVPVLCLLLAGVGVAGYETDRRDGFASRAAAAGLADAFHFKYNDDCSRYGWRALVCRVADGLDHSEIVLIGDSFAHAYSNFVMGSKRYSNFTFTEIGLEVCPLLIGYGPPVCQQAAETTLGLIKSHENMRYVFLAGNYSWYQTGEAIPYYAKVPATPEARTTDLAVISPDAFAAALKRTVEAYQKLGRNVVLFLTPPYGKDPRDCAPRLFKVAKCGIDRTTEAIRTIEASNAKLLKLWPADERPVVFDPFPYMCDPVSCRLTNGASKIYYVDSWHLSVEGGDFMAEAARIEFAKLIDNPK
jgi:peptidoglycan/LPS O-acetylase OafA/YrhL